MRYFGCSQYYGRIDHRAKVCEYEIKVKATAVKFKLPVKTTNAFQVQRSKYVNKTCFPQCLKRKKNGSTTLCVGEQFDETGIMDPAALAMITPSKSGTDFTEIATRPPLPPITFAPTQGTLIPALQPKVELGLTITYIGFYGVLFCMVYIQLWMIWYYRHKRFSYQTVFLFLTLVWSGIRVTLFSFYFNDCTRVNFFPVYTYWLMFCFPICLQFVILCLLVLFFAQVVFKARAKYEPSKFKRPLKVSLCLAILVFFTTNISCATITKEYQSKFTSLPVYMIYIRVAINDALFVTMSVILSYCIYKMAKMSAVSVVLEAKGTTVCKAMLTCTLIVFLYLSRAIYNLVAVFPVGKRSSHLPSFGYGWVNVTDQADFVELNKGYAYLSFAVILFVWEVLPMFTVVIFFRVRSPGSSNSMIDLPSHSHDSKAYFFDNPHRYDSDDEVSVRSEYRHSHQSEVSLNHGQYSINASVETMRGSPEPTRPHRLGYGAVMSADRQYSYSVSPVVLSPNPPTFGSS